MKTTPDPTLLDRDLALMRIFAEFTGKQLERQFGANRTHDEMTERVRSIIDTDRTRRALAAALIRFGEETGSTIIAEGVETEAELKVLRRLRANKAQGYLIGRPMPLASAVALIH